MISRWRNERRDAARNHGDAIFIEMRPTLAALSRGNIRPYKDSLAMAGGG
jgi:hypothetical protein